MPSLTFDPALNRYEISGAELDTERLAYLESIMNTLAQHSIIVPELSLEGSAIKAALAGNTYTLGEIRTEGRGAEQVVYPDFARSWDFVFTRDIVACQVWKAQDDAFTRHYSSLSADLLQARGQDASAQINLALLKEFVALAQVEGEHSRRMLQELRLLKGMLSLHSLGMAQRKIAEALGVDLSNSKRRTRRSGGQSLTLLLGEEVAAKKLYRGLSSFEELVPIGLLLRYFSYKRRDALQTPDDLQRFYLALKRWVQDSYLHDRSQAYGVGFPLIANLLDPAAVLPGDPEAVRGYFDGLDKEFVRFRKEHLDRIITRERQLEVYTLSTHERIRSQPYQRFLSVDTARHPGEHSRQVDVLTIDYVSPVDSDAPFGGTIHIIGHGSFLGLGGGLNPQRIADWMYENFSRTFGRRPNAFKQITCINFTACHFPKALAEYVTLVFVELCLEKGHFDTAGEGAVKRRSIPHVTVICSPHAALVYNASGEFVPFSVTATDDRMVPLPGVVLRTMDVMRSREFLRFVSKSGTLNFHDLSVQRFLLQSQVLSATGLTGEAFEHGVVSETELDQARLQKTAAYEVHELELAAEQRRRSAEAGNIIGLSSELFGPVPATQHRAQMEHLAYELAAIKPKGQAAFLRANTSESMRLLHGYYAEIRNRYVSRTASGAIDNDPGANSQQYRRALDELKRENRIKILVDPLDPAYHHKRTLIIKAFREHLGIVYRGYQDFPFYNAHLTPLLGVQPDNYASSAYYDQQLAEILLVVTKQEYQQITGIEMDKLWLLSDRVVSETTFREAQRPRTSIANHYRLLLGEPLSAGLFGSEQLGVSTAALRSAMASGDDQDRLLPAMVQLEQSLKGKRATLGDARSLKRLQDTQDHLQRARTALEKQQLQAPVLKTSARMASAASRLLGAFGVFLDFRTQPFHLDFSSLRSGVFTISDSLAVTKGLFDFTTDVGVALRLRLATSAFRAIWQSRLDLLFFKLNKLLLPLDVLFTAVSLYRNIDGVRLAKSAEEQALYLSMTVIDGAAFGVTLAGFALIAVPGVGVALILVGVALAVVNILLNAIVGLSSLENYRWHEKVGLFFGNLFGSSSLLAGSLTAAPTALEGITAQQQMRHAADQLFEGSAETSISSLPEQGIDLLLTPVLNDTDDEDQTNALKAVGPPGPNRAQGYTLAPLGLAADELDTWPDGKEQDKSRQVQKGWYLRRSPTGSGQARKLMVTMPATPGSQAQVLDFGPLPAVLLFGATPHLLLGMNPFGWAPGESPQEQARHAYQVKLYPGTGYTLQFKKSVMSSKDHDSHFDSRTRLLVPEGEYSSLPQVALDLSAQADGRETIRELDLSASSLEVIKFKDRSKVRLELVRAGSETPCALEQLVRTVQLPAHINFRSGRRHPVMAVVGEGSRVALRNAEGQSLLLLRPEVQHCNIEIDAAVTGFAVSI